MYESQTNIWLSKQVTKDKQSSKNKNKMKKKNKKQEKKPNQTNEEEIIRGDTWDRIGLKEVLAGKNKKLYDGKSKFQKIQVVKANDIRMYLDEQLQFSSLDERIYHEALVHVPMALTQKHKRILILGGGDGLALREVLKYSDVEHVDLVDIDSQVLQVASKVPEIVSLNEGALLDKRVHVRAMDARNFLKTNKMAYDIMIIDFPDPADAEIASLYSVEMFQMLTNYLAKDGMIVCQANSPEDTPTVFWSIGLTIQKAGFHTEGYHTIVPSFGDWGFQLASKTPFSPEQMKRISVPNRTLPKNVTSLFNFHRDILFYRRHAIVNKTDNLLLHKVYNNEVGN